MKKGNNDEKNKNPLLMALIKVRGVADRAIQVIVFTSTTCTI